MSFKREGDDGSRLNLLKKRRVAELLAEDIPDDEAILMSNGRYACTICHYRPVFDTVDMLTIHRGGKKHKHASEHHFAKKRELALLAQKRHHEDLLKNKSSLKTSEDPGPAPLLQKVEQAKKHALLKEAPYNPFHTHKNEGPSTKPKQKLFFQGIRQMHLKNMGPKSTNQQSEISNSTNQMSTECATTSAFSAKKVSQKKEISVKQTHSPGVSGIEIKPYVPKSKRGMTNTNTNNLHESNKRNLSMKTSETERSLEMQTLLPGVSNEQIKPYVPKSRRDINNTRSNSLQKTTEMQGTRQNIVGSSTLSVNSSYGYVHGAVEATSTLEESSSDSADSQDEISGGEVGNQNIQYITEFQSENTPEGEHLFGLSHSKQTWSDGSRANLERKKVHCNNKGVTIPRVGNRREQGQCNTELKKGQIRQSVHQTITRQLNAPAKNVKRHHHEQSELRSDGDKAEDTLKDLREKNKEQDDGPKGKIEETQTETSSMQKRHGKILGGGMEIKVNTDARKFQSKFREDFGMSKLNTKDRQMDRIQEDRGRKDTSEVNSSESKVSNDGVIGRNELVEDRGEICDPILLEAKQSKDRLKKKLSAELSNEGQKNRLLMKDSSDGEKNRGKEDSVEESTHSGALQNALQLLHDRQKSRLVVKEERTGGSNEQQRSEGRRKELQRYLELTSAGWVQDSLGNWVKGQDVEFDSDEEPPTS